MQRLVAMVGLVICVGVSSAKAEYPVLTQGQVVLVHAQRLVVTQEPPPIATVAEAPPAPKASDGERPPVPAAGAIWVAGHWAYGVAGLSWVTGRYIAGRPGHVFVPPRWAVLEDQYLFFTGFYVPHGVFVRSHFNRYYYSGAPVREPRMDRGPYWPVGAPTPVNRVLTSTRARDPYWPIGARSRGPYWPVGVRR